jgi:hypothetical protein
MEKIIGIFLLMLISNSARAQEVVVGKLLSTPKFIGEVETVGGEFFHGTWYKARYLVLDSEKKKSIEIRFTAPSAATLKKGSEIWGQLRNDGSGGYWFDRWGYITNLKCLMNTQEENSFPIEYDLKIPFEKTEWRCKAQ